MTLLVSLILQPLEGGRIIGKLHCQLIAPHLLDLARKRGIDATIPSDFIRKIRWTCIARTLLASFYTSSAILARAKSSLMVPVNDTSNNSSSVVGAIINGSASVSFGSAFETHYYQELLRGRGRLLSNQEFMADEDTAELVKVYAINRSRFVADFGRLMINMSSLGVLTGSQGHVRVNCSIVLASWC